MHVGELRDQRGGGRSQTGARTYSLAYRVIAPSQHYGAAAVLDAVPWRIGDPYSLGVEGVDDWAESDERALCLEIKAKKVDADGKGWRVDVEFGPANPADFGGIDNPLMQRAKKTWRGNRVEEVLDVDVEGRPVVNSAGDPFDPPVTRERSKSSLVIVRNEATYNEAVAQLYRDSVNESPVWGCDPGTLRLADVSGESAWSSAIGEYYVVTYDFEYRPEGWNVGILDAGLRQLNESTGVREQITIGGELATAPVLLDGEGRPLDEDRIAAGEAVYLEFKKYHARDFGTLGLDG